MQYGIEPPDYRLPDSTHLGSARLLVSDLDHSLEYYQTVIGLEVLSRQGSAASLGAHGGGPAILHLETRAGTKAPPRGGRFGLYHFAILLPERAALARFVRHLGELRQDDQFSLPVASADHAVSEAIYLWDPDGLGIEVYVDRPRSEWRLRGQEVFMTTERLDMRSLIAAAGDQAWDGVPRGTVLGHMHLQVSDLSMAEAFYHAALGFDKTVWNFPGALFLSAGGYHHHLGTNTWAGGVGHALDHEARLVEWELRLPSAEDRARASAHLRSAGFAVETQDGTAVVSDPWGTVLRLA
jgi:catechol 2,3-dioxygenase